MFHGPVSRRCLTLIVHCFTSEFWLLIFNLTSPLDGYSRFCSSLAWWLFPLRGLIGTWHWSCLKLCLPESCVEVGNTTMHVFAKEKPEYQSLYFFKDSRALPLHPGWLRWRLDTSGKPGPRREPCVKTLGFVLRFCSWSHHRLTNHVTSGRPFQCCRLQASRDHFRAAEQGCETACTAWTAVLHVTVLPSVSWHQKAHEPEAPELPAARHTDRGLMPGLPLDPEVVLPGF